jgi:ketosteroid isomerase-like protein
LRKEKLMIGVLLAKRNIPKAFDALNRKDIKEFLKDWADDAVMIYPGDVPGVSGTYKGKVAIRGFYKHEFEQFSNIHITPINIAVTNIFDLKGNNVVAVNWVVDVTNIDGYQINNGGVTIMKFQEGKLIHAKNFIFDTGDRLRKIWGYGK